MSFQAAIRYGFQNYANFLGVTKRRPFWLFALFVLLVNLAVNTLDKIIFDGNTVFGLIMLGLLVPAISSLVRRLRDAGFHWAFALLVLIPVLGLIALAVMCAKDSVTSNNSYVNGYPV